MFSVEKGRTKIQGGACTNTMNLDFLIKYRISWFGSELRSHTCEWKLGIMFD